MSTWQERLKSAIGPRGYENCMRRSLQTVVLYEAMRCVTPRLQSLRPFQRKAAYMDQIMALLESLDFLYPHQRAEVLWRTASSKEPLEPEIAWKRAKGIEKEMSDLAKKMKPFVAKAQTHDEAVNILIQSLYVTLTGFSGKPYPLNWEHAHNHVVMAYRMYYKFDELDSTFPQPVSPREIAIPLERPKITKVVSTTSGTAEATTTTANSATAAADTDTDHHMSTGSVAEVAALLAENEMSVNNTSMAATEAKRRRILQEVKEHLELLKEFDGVISDEDLAKRKRELFLALPGAPPPAGSPLPSHKKFKGKMKRRMPSKERVCVK